MAFAGQGLLPLGLGLVGGAFLGPLGFVAGAAVGGLIESFIFQPPSEVFEQESLADLSITTQTYGKRIPKLIGRRRLAGNIIWATDLVEVEHRDETSSGSKKGGGASSTSITKTHTVSFAMAICEGTVISIDRMWFDATLVFDAAAPTDSVQIVTPATDGTEGVKGISATGTQFFRLFNGSEEQVPSALQEATEGVGDVPAYRGTAYLEFEDLELGATGRIPNVTVEASTSVLPSGRPIALAYDDINQEDTLWIAYTAGTVDAAGKGFAQAILVPDLLVSVKGGAGDSPAFIDIALGFSGTTSFPVVVVGNLGPTGDPTLSILNADTGVALDVGDSGGGGAGAATSLLEAPILDDGELGTSLAHGFLDMLSATTDTYCLLQTIPRIVMVDHLTGDRTKTTPAATPVHLGADATNLYVVCQGADTVDVFVLGTLADAATPTVAVGDGPSRIAVDAANDRAWVTNTTDATVSRMTLSTLTVAATPAVGTGPVAVVVDSAGFVWVANAGATTLSYIDPTPNTASTIALEDTPGELAADANGGVWVTLPNLSMVAHVTSAGAVVTANIPLGPGATPMSIVTDADGLAYIVSTTAGVWVQATFDATTTEIHILAPHDANALGCVVRHLAEEAGVASHNIDISALDNTPVHMLISGVSSAITPLEELMRAFKFTMVESGEFLKFYFLGGTSQATLPESVTGAGAEDAAREGLAISRTQEMDLPTRATVTYASLARNYDDNTQSAALVNSQAPANVHSAHLAVSIPDDTAKALAETTLYEAWLNRLGFQFSLPPKFSLLEPVDIADVTSRTVEYSVRFLEMDYGINGAVDAKAVEHHSYIYQGFRAQPGSAPAAVQTTLTMADLTAFIVDLPPLDSTHVVLEYGIAIHTTEDGDWDISTLHRSIDSEVSYQLQHTQSLEAIAGTVALATADAPETVWDDTTTIVVVMRNGVLTTSTDLLVLNGANRAMVGTELIGFVTATLGAANTYTLSRLLRGLQGTESLTGTHAVTENFVFIDAYQALQMAPYTVGQRGIAFDYKAVNLRQALADVTATQATLNGARMKPWEVAPAVSTVDGSDNWTLNWLQRSRLEGAWVDGVGIGNDFDHTGFRVKIYQTEAYTTVLRTFTDTDGGNPADAEATKTQAYPIANQTTDFGKHNPHLFIGIAQLSTSMVGYETQIELQEIGVSSLTDNLEAWWKLEEASGSRADAQGSNILTDINTVTQATGKIASAGQFTRANSESLTIADNASLSLGADSDFVIAAWVYLDSTPAGAMILASKGDSAATISQEFQLIYSSGLFRFSVGDGAASAEVTASTFGAASTGVWYFVYAWHDSTLDTLNIMINNGTTDSVAWANGTQDTAQEFAIGQWSNIAAGGAAGHWDGRIDEVGFWKGGLHFPQERNDLYNGGAGVSHPFVN